ncbi:glycerol-3-phosphate dehydrogenase [Pseudooceanicola nanhaiensis]|uniref:glycerol-3-phosphate dehydrogenase n=1 Tax=Pseudooceanicola nanhaiensis TaxID=375761 RepID=UPI004059769D
MGESVDLFIIGGGINGCGIARDAAGRGLSVALAEMGDLGSGASGNTTKLVHGGLRYIERLQFRRLREAMAERDILLRMAPHAVRPLRVVLPYDPDLRLEADTPAARLLSVLLPWSGGRRPAWAISLALSLYGPRGPKLLPPKADLDLRGTAEGLPLQERFAQGWEVSDAVVDDARLVMLNARDAAQRGARILTRRLVTSARRDGDHWAVVVEDLQGKQSEYIARALVNAAGPWAGKVQASAEGVVETVAPGLVRGSHAVVPALFGHDKGYYLQAKDGRYIFALPFGRNHTLIGTTYVAHPDADAPAVGTKNEQGYMLEFVSRYFRRPVRAEDVVWSFTGVRSAPLDDADSATRADRNCVLDMDDIDGPPMLSLYSGRLTMYRKQAEEAMDLLAPHFETILPAWTGTVPLPGGDMAAGGLGPLAVRLATDYGFLGREWAQRLVQAYGTEARHMLGDARSAEDMGRDFGATLTEREVVWMIEKEFAQTAEDVLWRRSKLGLELEKHQVAALEAFIADHLRAD